MKFKATGTINLRAVPSISAPILGEIPTGTIVESDAYTWKAVTLPDGRKGFCTAAYLEPVVGVWYRPIRADKFKVTQAFLNPNPVNYPVTSHHPGTDYGTQGEDTVPLYFCADGDVIESGKHTSFGNYFFYYVSEVDRTFAYFHLRDLAPLKGKYAAGAKCGIAGKTGFTNGIHLHLECLKGKKTSADRAKLYTSFAALVAAAENADVFIRARL